MKIKWLNIVLSFTISLVVLESCRKDEVEIQTYQFTHTGIPAPPLPADNKFTFQKIELGRKLFYEKLLSKDNSISCASCHKQENGFSDEKQFSEGVDGSLGKRQSMAIINLAWNTNEFFWDGRAHLLRDQSVMPIEDPLEMKESLDNVVSKLNANSAYREWFKKAFGSEVVTKEKIGLALEQFLMSIVSYRSKFDLYLRGKAQLTASELRGKDIFYGPVTNLPNTTKGGDCAKCHSKRNFTNNLYMNNGLDEQSAITDSGRFKVTNSAFDLATFRVPTLRNIELTAPYMHDGRFETLEEVIDHYDNGIHPSSTVDLGLSFIQNAGGLNLSVTDKADLKAFLLTLTDNSFVTDKRYSDPF